jgi:hypothetical protein
VTYHISVERQGAGNHPALEVDGCLVDGTLVPIPPDGQSDVQVRVILR